MKSNTLSRAVRYFTDNRLDHLSLIFRNTSCNGLLNAMVVDTFAGLFVLLRPWQVHNPNSRAFIGVGAFNMISARAYRKLGGHGSLKMHPVDDVMLGKKVKQLGLHQDCLLGGKFVQVRWYGTVGEMNRGLLKNIFALYGYRISCAVIAAAGIIVMTIVPPWGMILAEGTVRILFGLALFCRLAVFSITAGMIQLRPVPLLWSFLTPYLIVRIIVIAISTTIGNQGIEWRGTRYSLGELKKQEEVVATIQQPDPRILELQKKIAELERRIKATGKKPSKSLKEKLEEFKKKLLAPPPLSTAKKTVHYKLIALLGKEALIERNGERITVRDGETLDGKKVRVESFAVRIGDKVLTLDFSQNEQKIPLPLPTPSFRRP
jgi:hypothetical protein